MDVTNVASVIPGTPLAGAGILPAGPGPSEPGEGGRHEVHVLVPVRGPRCARGHREPRERDQRRVVVHAPAGEVPPAPIAVRSERDAGGLQTFGRGLELLALFITYLPSLYG